MTTPASAARPFTYLGKTPAKERLLPQFLAALEDPEPTVVHATLQALDGCRAPELIPAYRKVAARFPEETAHIRVEFRPSRQGTGLCQPGGV